MALGRSKKVPYTRVKIITTHTKKLNEANSKKFGF